MPSAEHDNSRTSNTSGGGRRRSGLLNESLTKRNNLYDTLELTKNASDDDIKRAYRRLALRYHPDKNQNNAECNKKFQEINYANSILSNPSKRRIYDEYGDMGLKMVDQFGEERLNLILRPWVKWVLCSIMVLTCGCFGCCCCCCFCFQCCCNFCCGKCKPKDMEGDNSFDEFNNNRNESEEPTVSAQPQPTNQFTSTTNITVLCELDNNNDEQTTVPGRFEPPPPYSPPSPSSPLATNQTQTTTTMPNYGSTV